MGKEEEGSVCGKVTKGVPTEGASVYGQAIRSIARIEKKLSRRAKEKSRGTLWKRYPRRGTITRTRMMSRTEFRRNGSMG